MMTFASILRPKFRPVNPRNQPVFRDAQRELEVNILGFTRYGTLDCLFCLIVGEDCFAAIHWWGINFNGGMEGVAAHDVCGLLCCRRRGLGGVV
jgi:hypothetical protein